MRYELSTNEWSFIGPMLLTSHADVPPVDDRRVLNGILWSCDRVPWRDLPESFGSRATC